MDRTLIVRAAGLYVPILLAAALGMHRMRVPRQIAAALAGFCWCLAFLLPLQILNQYFHWWEFHARGGLIRQMPVDLYLGWAVLWGVLPILSFPRQRIWLVTTLFIAFDLMIMPACYPVVRLSPGWLVGESVAICLILLPSQLFSRWTWDGTYLPRRVLFQIISLAGLLFVILPETVFAVTGRGDRRPLLTVPGWALSLEIQLIAIIAVFGVSAAQEFVRRGQGTPLPLDPTQRLVVSGVYRYLANPMQTSCSIVLTAWGLLLREPWMMAAGPLTIVYSAGLAAWHEGEDLRKHFGDAWVVYRRNVPAWFPRWRPWHPLESPVPRLYVAENCGPCAEVRRWFESQHAVALEIVAAEDHPARDLTRMTYDPMDGTPPEEGVAAFARGLEHINLAWTLLGTCFRLPVVRWVIQVLLDNAGMGPKKICRRAESPVYSPPATLNLH
jgi:protein-S-isoprenylcysteine O-methyltransferase Ste14